MADATRIDSAHAEEVKKHVRVYLMVFAALAVLTVVTVAIGYLHLAIVPALILALFIASIKGGLVAAYFMHLVSEKRLILWLVGMVIGLLIVMFVLFFGAHVDQDGGGFVS